MRYCDETKRVDLGAPDCTGWLARGHPWHGCAEPHGHNSGGRLNHHQCKCGATWKSRKK